MTTELITEMSEFVNKHGGENTATHLMVQAIQELRRLQAENEALRAQVEALSKGQEPAQWQKRHQEQTEGLWENTTHHDAKWWEGNSTGWEIRALYAHPTPAPTRPAAPEGWKLVMPGGRKTDEWESARVADFNAGWNQYRKVATAALEKLSFKTAIEGRQQAGPDGWVLVPVVPTAAMLAAAAWCRGVGYSQLGAVRTAYRAMLAAAPQADAQKGGA